MAERSCYAPKTTPPLTVAQPFGSAEEAWFWFVCAQQARADGARFVAGVGAVLRPCEPVDILRVVDALRRRRVLSVDHVLVLRHYGRRLMAPDGRRVKEARAADLWVEALERMEEILIAKGIVAAPSWWQRVERQADFIHRCGHG